jgi:4'-phosphopantetheinyl transferase
MLIWPETTKVPPLPEGEVHIWRAGLDVPPSELESFQNLLDGPERERAARFHREEDRRRFIAAHGLLRTLLGQYLDAPPERLQFRIGRWGKPALACGPELPDIRFSLSHSDHLALFAFARGREVGVDVECIRSDFDWVPVARHFFSACETAALDTLPVAARRDAFFSVWTCKEACAKLTGEGISSAPARFEISLRPGQALADLGIRSSAEAEGRWTVRSLRRGPDWAMAVAAEGGGWNLDLRQWSRRAAECARGGSS